MAIRVSGKNMDLGDVLRGQAETRLNEAIRKYVDAGYSGHVTVARDGFGFKTECAVHFDHGPVMHVTGEAPDAYQSLGIAIERIAKQLRRFKRKRDRHGADRVNGTALPAISEMEDHLEDDVIEVTGAGAAIVAEPVDSAPTHSTTTAVAAFEKSDAPVLVFRNAGTQRINVLYRRGDGHYGWVDIG
ncbi:MAG: ribosome-associated translation inhibitor RaiA [Hyphomicrobiales bacterium]|uniref:ribosome hibernation-promoting factor, HPF/YfiA family n=1 Tax=Rhabdaerophilum calidifontis TaxID=2604328 RepID=UPI0012389BA3|nr:ribosome-associated translation inhibitor RaiA [Rhabdaerophilum calidifontis]MCA1951828.1 ribosome-associated translation inhibitor RaiA [Hyphomicrobiales bacterium]MCA1999126.1 ribosome-associated translation inhibitor RaiA [Hyphomicrobiales bacterium]